VRRLIWIAASLAVLTAVDRALPHLLNPYALQIVVLCGINVILAVSLNLINGFTGQFSIGHAGFMAVGAYTSAMLSIHLGVPWVAAMTQLGVPVPLAQGAALLVALLAGGADVNANGRNNWTALLLALESDRNEVAESLIKQPNLNLKAENPDGMTALMLAVWHKRADFVKKLLQRGADPNHQDKDGDSAVHGAAWLSSTDILSMLLDAGANPDFKNKLGGTAMMWAASYGQDEAVRILLNRGADPRIKDVDGVTAAGWAAKNGQGGLVMLLREAEKKR